MKIKPIIYHSKKGRKFIKSLTLEKIDFNNEEVNVTYEELPKFLKIDDLNEKNNDKKVLVKLNPKYKYPIKGKKMIRSLSCNPISDDNQISNKNINISFQEFNDNNYQIEVFKNSDFEQELIKLQENQNQTLNLLNKINNQIEQLNNENIKNNRVLERTANGAILTSNIAVLIPAITSAIVGNIPIIQTVGAVISASGTTTAGICNFANTFFEGGNDSNKSTENLEMENTNNFISIQIEDEINSMDLTNEPSTSQSHLIVEEKKQIEETKL